MAVKLRKLIRRYQTDQLSGWHKLRYATRQNQRNLLRQIERRYGRVKLSRIKGRTLLKWHAQWLDGTKYSAARAFTKKIRVLFGFGLTILDDEDCKRIRHVMSAMRFPGAPRRKQRVTAEQAASIRSVAWRIGRGSVALAQAFQFEVMLRQKDTIGEYLPRKLAEGGHGLEVGDEKWVRGLLWSEIDDDLILRHQTSKTNKPVVVDLKLAPMVIADLRRLGVVSKRGKFRLVQRLSGPVIVSETTGLPYLAFEFRRLWRAIARDAGVPDNVFNMDSRAGGITEAFDAGAAPDFIRSAATHSELATTQGYNRGDELARSRNVAAARIATRPATGLIGTTTSRRPPKERARGGHRKNEIGRDRRKSRQRHSAHDAGPRQARARHSGRDHDQRPHTAGKDRRSFG
ncbi:hypothetical protein IVB08_34580 [Bradyrhizobium sp. 173]|uniref:hypothetical protein n=1 Tax=Bradyrhizobium sp. 173 TaxID=2782644 RepID=UPI001FFA7E60|nr:hypothetical protein [Bradyrhizobium sp. 173]MCK1568987.1 hypothetical protein [Bradyrhizobium sp. 173]